MAAALPEGWDVRYTADGRPFFIDHSTKRTQWEPPLPRGWGEKTDPSTGRTFYVNYATSSTQWDDPRTLYNFTPPAPGVAPSPSGGSAGGATAAGNTGAYPAAGATYPAAGGSAYPAAGGGAATATGAGGGAGAGGAYPAAGGTYPAAAGGNGYPAAGAVATYPGANAGAGGTAGAGGGASTGAAQTEAQVLEKARKPRSTDYGTINAAASLAPVLVPDSQEAACSVCKEKFGFFGGRHHCRCCGHGVCSKCSEKSVALDIEGSTGPQKVCTKCVEHRQAGNHLCLSRYLVWVAAVQLTDVASVNSCRRALDGLTTLFRQASDVSSGTAGDRIIAEIQTVDGTGVSRFVDTLVRMLSANAATPQVKELKASALNVLGSLMTMVIVSSQPTVRFMGLMLSKNIPQLVCRMLDRTASSDAGSRAAAQCLEDLTKANSPELKNAVHAHNLFPAITDTMTYQDTATQVAIVAAAQALLEDSPNNVQAFHGAGGMLSLTVLLSADLGPNPPQSPMFLVVLGAVKSLASALPNAADAPPALQVEIAGYRDEIIDNDGVTSLSRLLVASAQSAPVLASVCVRVLCLLTSSVKGVTALLRVRGLAGVSAVMASVANEAAQADSLNIIANVARLGGAEGRTAVLGAGGLATAASGLDMGASQHLQLQAVELVRELAQDDGAAAAMSSAGLAGMVSALLKSPSAEVRAGVVNTLAMLGRRPAHRGDLVSQACVPRLADFILSGAPDAQVAMAAGVIESALETAASVRLVPRDSVPMLTDKLSNVACRTQSAAVKKSTLASLAALCGDPKPDLGALDEAARNEIGVINSAASENFLRNTAAVAMVTAMLTDATQAVRAAALALCTALVGFDGGADELASRRAVHAVQHLVEGETDAQQLLVAMAFFTRVWSLLCGQTAPPGMRAKHGESGLVAVRGVLICCARCNGDRGVLFHAAAMLKPIASLPEHHQTIASMVDPLVTLLTADVLPPQYIVDVATILTAVANSPERADMVHENGVLALVSLLNSITERDPGGGAPATAPEGLGADGEAAVHAVQALTTLSRGPRVRSLLVSLRVPLTFLPRLLNRPRDDTESKEQGGGPMPVVVAWALALLDNMVSGGDVGQLSSVVDLVEPLVRIVQQHFDVDPELLPPQMRDVQEQQFSRAARVLVLVFDGSQALWDQARDDVRLALAMLDQGLNGGRLKVATNACDAISNNATRESDEFRRRLSAANLPARLAQALRVNPSLGPQAAPLRLAAARCIHMLVKSGATELTGPLLSGDGVAAIVSLLTLPVTDEVTRDTVLASLRILWQLHEEGQEALFWTSVEPHRASLLGALAACLTAQPPSTGRDIAVKLLLQFARRFGASLQASERGHVKRSLRACVDVVVEISAADNRSGMANAMLARVALEAIEAMVAVPHLGDALQPKNGCAIVSMLLSGKASVCPVPVDHAITTTVAQPRDRALAFAMLRAMMSRSPQTTAEQLDGATMTLLVSMLEPPAAGAGNDGQLAGGLDGLLAVFERVCVANPAVRQQLFEAGLVAKLETLLAMGRGPFNTGVVAQASQAPVIGASSAGDNNSDAGSDAEAGGDDDSKSAGGDDSKAEDAGADDDADVVVDSAESPTPAATPSNGLDLLPALSSEATASALTCVRLLLEVIPSTDVVARAPLGTLVHCVVDALSTPSDGEAPANRAAVLDAAVAVLRLLADSDVVRGPASRQPRTGACRRAGAVRALLRVVFDDAAMKPEVSAKAIAALRALCTQPEAAIEVIEDVQRTGAAVRLCTSVAAFRPGMASSRAQMAAMLARVASHAECAAELCRRHKYAAELARTLVASVKSGARDGAAPYLAMTLESLMVHPEARTQAASVFNGGTVTLRECIQRASDPIVQDSLTHVGHAVCIDRTWTSEAPTHERRSSVMSAASDSKESAAESEPGTAAPAPRTSFGAASGAGGGAGAGGAAPSGAAPAPAPASAPVPGYGAPPASVAPTYPAYPPASAAATSYPPISAYPRAPTTPSGGAPYPPTSGPASHPAPGTHPVQTHPGVTYPPAPTHPTPGPYPMPPHGYAPGAGPPHGPPHGPPSYPPTYQPTGPYAHPGAPQYGGPGPVPGPAGSAAPPYPGPAPPQPATINLAGSAGRAAAPAPPAVTPAGPKDWECPACTFHCTAQQTKCSMCGVAAPWAPPPPAPTPAPAGAPAAPPTVRPTSGRRPSAAGEWECKHCTFRNTKPESLVCDMCAKPRHDGDGLADLDMHQVRCGKVGCGQIITCRRGLATIKCPKCNTNNSLVAQASNVKVKCSLCNVTLSVARTARKFKCPNCNTTSQMPNM